MIMVEQRIYTGCGPGCRRCETLAGLADLSSHHEPGLGQRSPTVEQGPWLL